MKKNLHIIIISFLFSAILWASISLSNDYYATFQVPLKLVDFQKGLTSGSKLPKKVSIKVKGKGWKLVTAKLGSESEYVVTANGDTGKRYINLSNYLSENQWLSSDVEVIDISPDTLTFNIEKLTNKKLKIEPDVEVSFRDGYGLATPVTVQPDSVVVYGPVSELKNMSTISTDPIKLENLSDKLDMKIDLDKKTGMNFSENSVLVSLNVQRIVDKVIEDVPVNILDVPADREVVLLPNKINIGVHGGIDILGKLTGDEFRAYVNYRDVVLDTLGGIIPKLESPRNVDIQYIKPEQLRYIIKKFN
jgi:YbbR domain-containing protein